MHILPQSSAYHMQNHVLMDRAITALDCTFCMVPHYRDVIMGAMALKSPASRLFTQPFVHAQIKDNVKAPRHWPFVGKIHRWPVNSQRASNADNVSIWWCHHAKIDSARQGLYFMMTSSNGNIFRVTGHLNSPIKGHWRGVLMFSLICVWINGWVNNGEAGDLRRYRAHCDSL